MATLEEFKAALLKWQQDKEDATSRAELLRCFKELGAWRVHVILDAASVAAGDNIHSFLPVWISCWGISDADSLCVLPQCCLFEAVRDWLQQLRNCGLAEPDPYIRLRKTLNEFAQSILLDPVWGSPWAGTRLWVAEVQEAGGAKHLQVTGARQPLIARLHSRSPTSEAEAALVHEQLRSIDFSRIEVLVARYQRLPPNLFNPSAAGQLRYLDLQGIECADLPSWVVQQHGLRDLDLSRCEQLEWLPESFSSLTALTELDLSYCKQLSWLPASFGQLRALQVLRLNNSGILELPLSFGQLSALRTLSAERCLLETLPQNFGELRALQRLCLSESPNLKVLPHSVAQLVALRQLELRYCVELTELPDSFGSLKVLKELKLYGCHRLAALPLSMRQLSGLQELDLRGCDSLVQPLPERKWPPQQQIAHVLDRQEIPAVIQLATQQETMLTTLERMSWLAVLLATATFIAFMQPPGGLDDDSKQVLVSNSTACASYGLMRVDQAALRGCSMLVFFILDGMSFGFAIGCVMMIIVMSMPRRQYRDDKQEAGRFWLLLLLTWVLLYAAVLTGFGAFIASGLAVHNRASVVVGPVIPGMILLVAGIIAIVQRFRSLHPGWPAVWAAFACRGSKKPVSSINPSDVEMGQGLFWVHCKQLLSAEKRLAGLPVNVVGASQELTRLLGSGQAGTVSQQQQQ